MSLMTQQYSQMNTQSLATFGVSVTYTVAGGSSSTITAIVGTDDEEDTTTSQGETTQGSIPIKVSADDVASPAKNDTITCDSKTYIVMSRLKIHGMWRLQCVRITVTERSHGGYRQGRE